MNFRARLNEIFTDLTSLDVKKKLESLMVFVAMRQYFSFFIYCDGQQICISFPIFRVFFLWSSQSDVWCSRLVSGPLRKQFFSKNNVHNTLDLVPLTRVRLMLHQSQAPTNGRPADQHYAQWKLTPDKYILLRKFIPRCIITLSTQIGL